MSGRPFLQTPGPTNVALGKPATADSTCNSAETPDKAVDGTVANNSKWCSLGSTKWWRVDLGSSYAIRSFTLRHAGDGGETASWNTRDFDLQVSSDGANWTTVVQARGNTANISTHDLASPVTGRYVRLNVITPTQTSDTAARVYEVEVYA